MRTRTLALLAGLVVAAALALLLGGRRPAHAPTPTAVQAAPAPTSAPAAAHPKISGSYADDWQTACAPLTGGAQAACTQSLDAAYGKSDAAPVPPPGR